MQRFWNVLLISIALMGTLHPLSASVLVANITSNTSVPDVWTYTIFNNESNGSSNFVDQFTIGISDSVPYTVTAEPSGWSFQLDVLGPNSITFFSNDPSTDLAPGLFLGGFSLSAPGASDVIGQADINSWDHNADAPGPNSVAFSVDTPGAGLGGSSVPEPWTGSTMGLALVAGSFWLRKKSRSRR